MTWGQILREACREGWFCAWTITVPGLAGLILRGLL